MIKIAVAAGVDEAKFTTCLDDPAAAAEVAAITAKATTELGINSTPTIYLASQQYVGLKSPTDWSALIDAELAKLNASSASPAPSASAAASAAPSAAPSAAASAAASAGPSAAASAAPSGSTAP